MTLPIFLVVILGMFESARIVYIRSVLESDARSAAGIAAIDQGRLDDCKVWAAGRDSGGGIVTIKVDAGSHISESQPERPTNKPTTPNTGLMYVYPAVSTTNKICGKGNCDTDVEGPGDPDAAYDQQATLDSVPDCSAPYGSTADCAPPTGDPPHCPAITVYERYYYRPYILLPAGLSKLEIDVCASERIITQDAPTTPCHF